MLPKFYRKIKYLDEFIEVWVTVHLFLTILNSNSFLKNET